MVNLKGENSVSTMNDQRAHLDAVKDKIKNPPEWIQYTGESLVMPNLDDPHTLGPQAKKISRIFNAYSDEHGLISPSEKQRLKQQLEIAIFYIDWCYDTLDQRNRERDPKYKEVIEQLVRPS